MPRQVFTAGEILTAANMNDLSDQTVMVFDDAAARTTAIPSPIEGMVTYLKDTNEVEKYDGSAFVGVATPPAILQVVSTNLTSVFSASVAQGAETEITGLTVTITPTSTSSKVLVNFSVNSSLTNENADNQFLSLFRGATRISIGDTAGSRQRVTTGATGASGFAQVGYSFLDSPNTTSAVTYSLKVSHRRAATETVLINRISNIFNDNDANTSGRGASTITVMEVAG
jgi:hypothetical protein